MGGRVRVEHPSNFYSRCMMCKAWNNQLMRTILHYTYPAPMVGEPDGLLVG